MADHHIQTHIKQYLSQHNSSLSNRLSIPEFTKAIPTLSPRSIRTLTKTQEQHILQKVVPVRPNDLFQEVSRVCPEGRDIASISQEQVTSRLQLYSTKLVLGERVTGQWQSQEWEQSKGQSFFGEVQFDMRLIEQQQNEDQMRNIFEECGDHHWNAPEYFSIS